MIKSLTRNTVDMNLTFIKSANLHRTRREDRRSQLGEGRNREDRNWNRLQQSMMGKNLLKQSC